MTYTEHFQKIVEDQLARVEKLKNSSPVPDFAAKEKIIIGTIDGDGIGPVIMDSCRAILEKLLADDIASGKIELRKIEGLTIENRIAKMETVPADVLARRRRRQQMPRSKTFSTNAKLCFKKATAHSWQLSTINFLW